MKGKSPVAKRGRMMKIGRTRGRWATRTRWTRFTFTQVGNDSDVHTIYASKEDLRALMGNFMGHRGLLNFILSKLSVFDCLAILEARRLGEVLYGW